MPRAEPCDVTTSGRQSLEKLEHHASLRASFLTFSEPGGTMVWGTDTPP